MPAQARKYQLTKSLVYHIFNRSNGKAPIFNAPQDYRHFLKLLIDYKHKFGLTIYHWVIMLNHYHFLCQISQPESISKLMAGIGLAYTFYHHKVYESAGFLWQGRFKSQPVQRETYLLACGRYIERNPVKAGLVQEAWEYPYSSARFYCLGKPDGITTESPEFAQFGAEISQRQAAYKKFLRNFNAEEERSFDNLEQPRGDKEFIKRLIKVNGLYVPKKSGRPNKGIIL